jgi:perosamine synthetase
MTEEFIPVNTPLLDGNEKKYLIDCINSGWISSEGPYVEKFEAEIAKRFNRKYAIAVTNGTAAIDLAIEALDIGPGDEVILPTFTIISCILQIVRSGASPVLIDSDAKTWNIDSSKVEEKITKKTKAILVPHIYGLPADIDPILAIAKKYHIAVIEDSAEMHGQDYFGKPCGSFGDISTLSFYPNKHITTGEGGMVLTNDENIANTCRSLRNLCFQKGKRFIHERLGWNMRMTNIQAALGVAQLERLDEFVDIKREMGCFYLDKLSDMTHFVQLPTQKMPYAENIYWVFGLVLSDQVDKSVEQIMAELRIQGVDSRPFFWPMHLQPVLKRLGLFKGESYPVAEHLGNRGFYIPSGLGLRKDEMTRVVDAVKLVLKN